jgi:hypothetical protein
MASVPGSGREVVSGYQIPPDRTRPERGCATRNGAGASSGRLCQRCHYLASGPKTRMTRPQAAGGTRSAISPPPYFSPTPGAPTQIAMRCPGGGFVDG